ncbi:MAG: hypothetical protein AMS17_03390 [Spirochaetes bacterium DG_61]|nr:MAG: hypothetical protein AMS17_03390 [Spirochaetes bacterium DG_61]
MGAHLLVGSVSDEKGTLSTKREIEVLGKTSGIGGRVEKCHMDLRSKKACNLFVRQAVSRWWSDRHSFTTRPFLYAFR